MLSAGELQAVQGGQADGEAWLSRAHQTLETAATVATSDTASACTLAYDAARFACTALLVQQGVRPTTKGGHLVVDEAVRAQFGDNFRSFRTLRIRRHELEYPDYPDEPVEEDEAANAISSARAIIDAAEKLLPHLGFFR
jgi:HEPN domain-containing protein